MTMEKEKEIRNVASEVRFSEEEGIVEGYAMLFDVQSDGLPFYETIERGALDGVVERSDVFALLNHSLDRGVLARSNKGKGSLSLTLDEKGLKYRFTIPDTAVGAGREPPPRRDRQLVVRLHGRRGQVGETRRRYMVAPHNQDRRAVRRLARISCGLLGHVGVAARQGACRGRASGAGAACRGGISRQNRTIT